MKTIFSIVKLTIVTLIMLAGIYPLAMFGIAQFAPNHGQGETIALNNKTVGYRRIGQEFSQADYFWGRPSAVAYNAAGSAGSNKGPSNADYLAAVQKRIDTFLVAHPYLKKSEIPADMGTASGSGLDPDISVQGAKIQIARIAQQRGISEKTIERLLDSKTNKHLLGPQTVNVLELNTALDNLK